MTLYYQFFRFLILPGKFQDRIARLDNFRDKSEQSTSFFFEDSAKDRTYNNPDRVSQDGRLQGNGFCQTLSADDLVSFIFCLCFIFFGLESEALTIIYRDTKMSETILFDHLVQIL
jgi:hypothetical protein